MICFISEKAHRYPWDRLIGIADFIQLLNYRRMKNQPISVPLLGPHKKVPAILIQWLFGQEIIAVPLKPQGEPANCYWNASKVADETEGEVLTGYRITEHRGVMIEGEHHAIVRQQDGSLVDVTPYNYDHSGKIGFVPDGKPCPPLTHAPFLHHIIHPLGYQHLVNELAKAHRKATEAQRAASTAAYRAGNVRSYPKRNIAIRTPELNRALESEKVALERFRLANERLWTSVQAAYGLGA